MKECFLMQIRCMESWISFVINRNKYGINYENRIVLDRLCVMPYAKLSCQVVPINFALCCTWAWLNSNHKNCVVLDGSCVVFIVSRAKLYRFMSYHRQYHIVACLSRLCQVAYMPIQPTSIFWYTRYTIHLYCCYLVEYTPCQFEDFFFFIFWLKFNSQILHK